MWLTWTRRDWSQWKDKSLRLHGSCFHKKEGFTTDKSIPFRSFCQSSAASSTSSLVFSYSYPTLSVSILLWVISLSKFSSSGTRVIETLNLNFQTTKEFKIWKFLSILARFWVVLAVSKLWNPSRSSVCGNFLKEWKMKLRL